MAFNWAVLKNILRWRSAEGPPPAVILNTEVETAPPASATPTSEWVPYTYPSAAEAEKDIPIQLSNLFTEMVKNHGQARAVMAFLRYDKNPDVFPASNLHNSPEHDLSFKMRLLNEWVAELEPAVDVHQQFQQYLENNPTIQARRASVEAGMNGLLEKECKVYFEKEYKRAEHRGSERGHVASLLASYLQPETIQTNLRNHIGVAQSKAAPELPLETVAKIAEDYAKTLPEYPEALKAVKEDKGLGAILKARKEASGVSLESTTASAAAGSRTPPAAKRPAKTIV